MLQLLNIRGVSSITMVDVHEDKIKIGKKFGASSHVSSYADAVGGIVLIGIGIKILHQHGVFTSLF